MRVLFSAAVLVFLGGHPAMAAFDHSHGGWDQWLKKYVSVKGSVTTVNYKAAKTAPEPLGGYVKTLEAVTAEEYGKFSDPQKLAFLLNAYNSLTVKLVVENYPVKSIKDIGGLFGSPWKKKFFRLFGEERNLDFIEHDTIRKNFNEPRIHFGVVCASKGCPGLPNEAFRAEKLEQQLERGAVTFLKDTDRNRYDAAKNEFKLSKIFKWFGDDFTKKHGTVQDFLAPRMGKDAEEQAKMKKAEIDTLDYDWTLNETPAAGAKS